MDNVDNQFQVASLSMRATKCGQCGQSFFFCPPCPHFFFFFLRGNSLRGDLWTMWTSGQSFLNWCGMKCQPSVTYHIHYTSITLFIYKYIVHIVHKPSNTAQAVPLRVGHTVFKPWPTQLSTLSTNCLFFKQHYASFAYCHFFAIRRWQCKRICYSTYIARQRGKT